MSKIGSSAAASVVTEVDRQAQTIILQHLDSSRQQWQLGLLAEESQDDGSRLSAPAFWCIDPLDGTLPFIEGRSGFAVSIALVRQDGVPLIGVAIDPVSGVIYHATRGGGAWRQENGQRQPTPLRAHNPNNYLTFFTDRSFTHHNDFSQVTSALIPIAHELGLAEVEATYEAGGVLHALWLLERGPGCYFKFPKSEPGGGSAWDFAATTCIYNEVGCPVSDIRGNPLPLNHPDTTYMHHCGICYASEQRIADAIYQLHRELRPQH